MTDGNMARYQDSPWLAFWRELQPAYQMFEASKVPPRIGICDKQYVVLPGAPNDRNHYAVESELRIHHRRARTQSHPVARRIVDAGGRCRRGAPERTAAQALSCRRSPKRGLDRSGHLAGRQAATVSRSWRASGVKIRCNLQLPSCKKWAALQSGRKSKRVAGKSAKAGAKVASRTGKKKIAGGSAAAFVAK